MAPCNPMTMASDREEAKLHTVSISPAPSPGIDRVETSSQDHSNINKDHVKDGPAEINIFSPATSEEERALAMRLARQHDPGPDRFSKRWWLFIAYALIVIQNSNDNGFDGSIMSSVNSMSQYHAYFDLSATGTGPGISLVFVSPNIR